LTTFRKFLVAATVTTALAAAPATATAAPGGDGNNNTVRKITQAMTAEGVLEHERELQAISDRNGGTRVSGSEGYDESADYAERIFREAGLEVTRQDFFFNTFITTAPTVFRQVAPGPVRDLPATIMSYSGSGNTPSAPASKPTGAITGCLPSDFGPTNDGTIVLVSRGACTFATKATNAAAAGAAGVVIYNNTAGPLNGTLGDAFGGNFSVIGVTQALGQELVALVGNGLRLQLVTETRRGEATTSNVIAQTPGGNKDNVVMIGGHLDSVNAGPGINDNGSGAGSVLELAQLMSKTKTANAVRFAVWAAEESGLVGSRNYVTTLSQAEKDKLAMYLNFDMVASPNFVRFVYDGDDSVGDGNVGPAGSAQIEQAFTSYFASQGLASDPTDFSGRSDYGPFIAAGIPSGGLFTGAEGLKTPAQAAIYGGVAGQAYDPCYHQACDSLRPDFSTDPVKAALYRDLAAGYPLVGNVNLLAQEQMGDAIAAVTLTYAISTSSVNEVAGAPGKRQGQLKPGGSGTGGTSGTSDGSGGGLHDEHEDERVAS